MKRNDGRRPRCATKGWGSRDGMRSRRCVKCDGMGAQGRWPAVWWPLIQIGGWCVWFGSKMSLESFGTQSEIWKQKFRSKKNETADGEIYIADFRGRGKYLAIHRKIVVAKNWGRVGHGGNQQPPYYNDICVSNRHTYLAMCLMLCEKTFSDFDEVYC